MQVSKNYDKGRLIINPFDLVRLANEAKSIYHVNWGVKPAAFIISMQFRIVIKMIESQQLYIINKRVVTDELFKPLPNTGLSKHFADKKK